MRHVNAAGEQSFMRLSQVVKLWPTPRAHEREQSNSADNGVALSKAVKYWLTPLVQDSHSPTFTPGWGVHLRTAVVLWNTPTHQDSKNATLPASPATRDTLPGDLLRLGASGALNPDWVDLMMGLPAGWTSPVSLPAPAKSHSLMSRRVQCQRMRLRRAASAWKRSVTASSGFSFTPSPLKYCSGWRRIVHRFERPHS